MENVKYYQNDTEIICKSSLVKIYFIAYITGVILPINLRGNIHLKIVLLYKMQLLSSN